MNEAAKDGGPAFPRPSYGPNEPADGMSLRDWFAGQALVGAAQSQSCQPSAEGMAVRAYALADAMIAEHSKAGHRT